VLGQLGQEEEDLFAAALALPASERPLYLQRACNSNSALLSRLIAMIDAFGDAKGFISDQPLDAPGGSTEIGPYRLLQELGEGGCGIAYLADQVTPVRRQVAVKVIKPGMDTKALIARFGAERQVLALLDHPNIAKVFDAGTTSEGRPYFVMELVRGIKITEFCVQSRMTIQQRLSLFIQVSQAIQHAHQKGIIHRDIKPSNVLVTMHDGRPLAKVIDFGIAKAIQGRLIDETVHTEIHQIMGTPAYISPEQTRPTQSSVDTRSDIYSLGVLLYELLTSQTPFDAHELAEASIEALRERICTEEPLRPSRRLNSFSASLLEKIATGSSTTATRLVKEVRDDLDWVVMRCLEKAPSRRYQTVSELIADLDRYLRHKPVLARSPTLAYTFRKLARRHRVAFAAGLATAIFLFFITAFAVIMTIQAQRIASERDLAERERQGAEKVSNVALNVFAIADPFQSFTNEVSAPAVLDQAAKSIQRELHDQPIPRARLLRAVGLAYIRRGEFKPAIEYLRDSAHVLGQLRGAESEALKATIDLSSALRMSGDLHAARRALSDAEDFAQAFGLLRSAAYAQLLLNRGRIYQTESRIQEAKADYERSLRLYRDVVGARSVEVAEVLSELSTTYIWTDDNVLAEQTARESIAIFGSTVPSIYPDRVHTEMTLAEALLLQNRLDEAAPMLEETLRKSIQLFGKNSVEVADALDRLADVKGAQGRLDEAEKYSRDAVATARMVYGDDHTLTATMGVSFGRTLAERGKYSEAEATLRQSLKVLVSELPPNHQYTASAEYFLGETLLATNRLSEAERVLISSMERWKRSDAPTWRAMRSASALGETLCRQGRLQEGKNYLSESFDQLSRDSNADPAARKKARARVARFLQKTLSNKHTAPAPKLTIATQ
jgi:eukaryotic-like serine/threonine-protein kinase